MMGRFKRGKGKREKSQRRRNSKKRRNGLLSLSFHRFSLSLSGLSHPSSSESLSLSLTSLHRIPPFLRFYRQSNDLLSTKFSPPLLPLSRFSLLIPSPFH